jgi:hypothetical protein
MHRFILIFIAEILFSCTSVAQYGRLKTDSVTWQLYQEKKWGQLLAETESSLRDKIDFYYLRVRAGVAAYEMKKYRSAAAHFQKAYAENTSDGFLNASFYWALLMSGRVDEANCLADRLAPEIVVQQQITKKGIVFGIAAESLLSFNSEYKDLLAGDIAEENSYSNYRSLLKQQQYSGISFDHHIQPRLNVFQSISYMDINRIQQYRSTLNLLDTTKEASAYQYQYYINGRFLLEKGWSISSSITRLWGKSYYHVPEYSANGAYNLTEMSWGISDYLVTAGIAKEMVHYRPKIVLGYGEINGFRQVQTNLQVIIYPFGNVNFYLIPEGSLHWDEGAEKIKLVYNQKMGLKTGPIWLTGEYSTGTIKNFFSEEGLIVYNMPENIRNRVGITLWAPLFKYRLNLTLRYLQSAKEGITFVYSDASNYKMKLYTFTDKSFLISLKWNL